nr:hypothetical protein [Tanacetum cinerariifolium]
VKHVEAAGRRARLGSGVEKATERDIGRAIGFGFVGELQLRMAGGADDGLVAEQRPGVRQRAIGLAQVHAHAEARGDFGVIVDDQAGLVA